MKHIRKSATTWGRAIFLIFISVLFVQCGPSIGDAKKKMKAGDMNGAVTELVELANKGNDKAVDELIKYCIEIDNTPKVSMPDEAKKAALPILEERAESTGDCELIFLIKSYYFFLDDKESEWKWALIGDKHGDSRCSYLIGSRLKEQGKYNQAIPYLIKGSEGDWAPAYYDLAQIYLNPKYPKADKKLGLDYMMKAADNGDKDAMRKLADYYAMGDGVPEDIVLGLRYFQASGKSNDYVEGLIMKKYNADKELRGIKLGAKGMERIMKLLRRGTILTCDNGYTGGKQKITLLDKEELTMRFEYENGEQSFSADIKYSLETGSLDLFEPLLNLISVEDVKGIELGTAAKMFEEKFITLSPNGQGIKVNGLRVMAGDYKQMK